MKSKQQKTQEMDQAKELAGSSKSLIFVDFSKTPVTEISKLKVLLREIGSSYKVVKKRLLRIVFQEKGIEVDAKQFPGQLATIFSDKDISDPAGIVAKFSRELGKDAKFQMMGGFDFESARFFEAADITRIGNLPGRPVLLAQFAGLLKAPLSQLANVLDQISKKKA